MTHTKDIHTDTYVQDKTQKLCLKKSFDNLKSSPGFEIY